VGVLFPTGGAALVRRDRWLLLLFAAALVALVVRAARKEGGALVRNQAFGARFLAGEDPYADPALGHRVQGPYPPSFALVAAPLSLLPTTAARVVWASAQALALVLSWLVLRGWARRYWPRAAPHAPVLFAAAILLASRYLLRDAAGGGGNLLFGTLALVGLDLALRGREVEGGGALALSLALKPNLAPLLLFLACRRRWKAVAGCILAGAVFFLSPACAYGWGRYIDLSARWTRDVARFAALDDPARADLVPDGLPVEEHAMNQDLRAAVRRFLGPPGATGAPDVHVLSASPEVAGAVARVLGVLLAAVACACAARAGTPRGEALSGLAFLPLAMLVSPVSWKAHHAALLPLFFALACEARARPARLLSAFLVLVWLACDLLSEEIVGERAKEVLQSLSIVTLFDLLLLALALGLARPARGDPSAA